MALPNAYLTSTRNLGAILDAIKKAKAPPRFTLKFLESLDYKSSSDRLIIGVLKSIKFLSENGEPTERYFAFLDESRSKQVLAEGLRDAYADLFQIDTRANELSRTEIKNKLRTLSQGQLSDSVLDKMAMTFKALADQADFSPVSAEAEVPGEEPSIEPPEEPAPERTSRGVSLGALTYAINIQLPESRDQAVYDALFRSLKEHLLR